MGWVHTTNTTILYSNTDVYVLRKRKYLMGKIDNSMVGKRFTFSSILPINLLKSVHSLKNYSQLIIHILQFQHTKCSTSALLLIRHQAGMGAIG